MHTERSIRFKVGDGSWYLEIKTIGNLNKADYVQLGFYWRDKPFPTHDTTLSSEEFLKGLVELRLIDAQTSAEREGSRDSSAPSASPDEVFRAWSSAYAWPKEEPTTTGSESTGVRRSERDDFDISGRDYFTPSPGFRR